MPFLVAGWRPPQRGAAVIAAATAAPLPLPPLLLL